MCLKVSIYALYAFKVLMYVCAKQIHTHYTPIVYTHRLTSRVSIYMHVGLSGRVSVGHLAESSVLSQRENFLGLNGGGTS